MGSSWNPFSTSPRRRPSYAGSSYSSSSRHHSSTSRYKRSPRDGYLSYLYSKVRHFLREIWRYAQRHPYKIFFMVIMPLVSGGVLTKFAKQFGVTLPDMGGKRGGGNAGGYYGSDGYGVEGRGGGGFDMQSLTGGIQTAQSLAGGVSGLASLAGMASKFM